MMSGGALRRFSFSDRDYRFIDNPFSKYPPPV